MSQLVVLAGGNGSGKTRFFEIQMEHLGISFVNADRIAKDKGKKITDKVSKAAQETARTLCADKIARKENFCFETVFSHESKIELIRHAKEQGYEVSLIYFHINNPMINVARVHQRKKLGGHDVPQDRIESRIPRTIKNIKIAITIVDEVLILDNSSTQDPYRRVVHFKNNKIAEKSDAPPAWASEFLALLEDRSLA